MKESFGFSKRKKEMARKDRQKEKAARKAERKARGPEEDLTGEGLAVEGASAEGAEEADKSETP